MSADARMIGINHDGDISVLEDLDLGWVRVMEKQGFEARVADVGGPLLSTVAVLSVVEAARINKVFKKQASIFSEEAQCAKEVKKLLKEIGKTHYFSPWVIVETANID